MVDNYISSVGREGAGFAIKGVKRLEQLGALGNAAH